jgi:hypothetical protein
MPMNREHTLQTHVWSDGTTPRRVDQDGQTVFHRHCELCWREFAMGIGGLPDWEAAYVSVFRIEPLTKEVSQRWLTEECPRRVLRADDIARTLRYKEPSKTIGPRDARAYDWR